MKVHLISKGKFKLYSGKESNFKIDCDALTDEDIECLAILIKERVGKYSFVYGISKGGFRIVKALEKYAEANRASPTLIVDDVLTTGSSMEQYKKQFPRLVKGAVIFARGKCPDWIIPVFQMTEKR